MSKRRFPIVCLCALTLAGPGRAEVQDEAQPWRFSIGYASSSGRYGTADKTTFSQMPLSLEWSTAQWALQIGASYLHRRGPSGVVIVPDGGVIGPAQPVAVIDSASGWGDTFLSATRYYLLDQNVAGINLHLRGGYKIATGSRPRGLSTGANDASAGIELTRFWGPLETAATFNYSRPGKADGFELRNHWSSRWRARWSVMDALTIDVTHHAGERVALRSTAPRDTSLGIEWRSTRDLRLYGHVLKGASAGSADSAAGVTLGWGF